MTGEMLRNMRNYEEYDVITTLEQEYLFWLAVIT